MKRIPGKNNTDSQTAGVISDTHGVLVPEALKILMGVDLIIHAGDIDTPAVLNELSRIAPVIAVRGNMDKGNWASDLCETEIIEIGQCLLYVLHDINRLDLDPSAAGMHAVIHGHTHQPSDELRKGIRLLNPGSATHPRRNSPPSLLRLYITGTDLRPELIHLD
ncbi:MAG: metallophosphoesterase family protein [Deltaproteobacteria bacterium]|nr:metallophosphoesterase family protein [Deltaproteobacteria bacterium]